MKLYEIKHRFTGKVLFSLECKSLKICVAAAIKAGTNLTGANLTGADLSGADLSGADLTWANLTWADLTRANLSWTDLTGADLSGADLTGANLTRADLTGANLTRANLTGADLSGADLSGADGEKIKIEKTPLQIIGLRWNIIIFDNHMKIGCEFHSIKDWRGYDDERISQMDDDALEFWQTNKAALMAICGANGRCAA